MFTLMVMTFLFKNVMISLCSRLEAPTFGCASVFPTAGFKFIAIDF
jgi:hypothetical protein